MLRAVPSCWWRVTNIDMHYIQVPARRFAVREKLDMPGFKKKKKKWPVLCLHLASLLMKRGNRN